MTMTERKTISRHMDLLVEINRMLRGGGQFRLSQFAVEDVAPHYWREEADSLEEWFIRTCRGLGIHATYDLVKNDFIVTKTRDVRHEATITWPNRVDGEQGDKE